MRPRRSADRSEVDRHYTTYLIVIAVAGLALVSYDYNLLVLAIPDIARQLDLSQSRIGSLIFFISAAQLVVTLAVGYTLDVVGRRRMWMLCLCAAAAFTGLTYFVQNFWQLVVVRMLASSFAQAEFVVSITIVNEELSAKRRGMLYSIVQSGWPVGVLLASAVYLLFSHRGWRFIFLLGIVPMILVTVGRYFIRESDRFRHLEQVRAAQRAGNGARVKRLLKRYDVDVDALRGTTVKQLFAHAGPVRRQLVLLSAIWMAFGASIAATNFFITDFLTRVKGFTAHQAATLLLVSAGVGILFYWLGGWLGERRGRRQVLIVTALLVPPLNLLFLLVHDHAMVLAVYFLIYQVTNGTWSGAGYAYQAESFPTRVRGTAVGFLGAAFAGGILLGSGVWTLLMVVSTPTMAWLVVAVGAAFGQWLTLFARRIPPGMRLEEIAT
ncbi:MAG: MFS transporter [Longimicrobiales bacterium]